jgi:hypothetical protein
VKYGKVISVCVDLRELGLSSLLRANALFKTLSKVAALANPAEDAFLNRGPNDPRREGGSSIVIVLLPIASSLESSIADSFPSAINQYKEMKGHTLEIFSFMVSWTR